ncbi:MAG: acyltransferase [Lentisphaerae bacterium]|nr:acyltransferase [Lentisphaerota bacterium]
MVSALVDRMLSHVIYHGMRVSAALSGVDGVVRYMRHPHAGVAVRLLRAFGATIGEGTRFKGRVVFDNVTGDQHSTGDFRHLTIGANCFIGEDVYLDLAAPIVVGDNTMISARAAVLTHADCNRSAALARVYPRVTAGVTIEPGCWIGFGATLLPGVCIGREGVMAAGAVVTESTEPRSLAAGVPARLVKRLPLDTP